MEPRQVYYLIVWPIAGGAIGYAASRDRGYSPWLGLALGMLFGPLLAWVLFLIDGIFTANELKRCPHCAEWIEPQAKVCRFCQRDVPAAPRGPARLLRLVRRQPAPADETVETVS
jgi:hypothetical protein